MSISAHGSALRAAGIFRLFEDGEPDLVDLGLPAVTENIGGMFAGNLVGLACGQNVGKSSLLLAMATTAPDIGIVELEDGPDVWGARLLARYSDIPPTRIRKKELSEGEIEQLREILKNPMPGPRIEYAIGGGVDAIATACKKLVSEGCKVICLNYLQKARGHHAERRVEVGNTMYAFLQACAPVPPDPSDPTDKGYPGAVPVLVSQLTRMDPTKEPFPSHMKESGDIEAECRLIVMGWRDPGDPTILRCKVAKSSFGGGGLRFAYRYTKAEYLVPVSDDIPDEEDEF